MNTFSGLVEAPVAYYKSCIDRQDLRLSCSLNILESLFKPRNAFGKIVLRRIYAESEHFYIFACLIADRFSIAQLAGPLLTFLGHLNLLLNSTFIAACAIHTRVAVHSI